MLSPKNTSFSNNYKLIVLFFVTSYINIIASSDGFPTEVKSLYELESSPFGTCTVHLKAFYNHPKTLQLYDEVILANSFYD
jgi:hypothetical protein